MGTYKDLLAYKKAFELAIDIHKRTATFPKEELYSLTNQIRRSSRSVCINMAEGFRKLRYPAHFVAKLTDADMENSETEAWLDFSVAFEYLSENEHTIFYSRALEVGRLLNHIIENPGSYGAKGVG